MRYGIKWPQYERQWDSMVIKHGRIAEFNRLAAQLYVHKARYQAIEAATGVPWHLVAVLHLRESGADFGTYLGNGQSLRRRTTIVPKGRGPFDTFEAGAIDALKLDGLTSVKDWRLEKELYYCETFNGGGYDARGLPSPYLWGGTSIQRPGKYTSDHGWDGKIWDTQPGCAPILSRLAAIDHSIRWIRET
jgi:lysozyme family protein